jgi:crossover junction endodeoxyribonuclease RuvC
MTYYIGIDQSYTSTGLVGLDHNGRVITQEVISSLKAEGDYYHRAKIVSESIAAKINTIDQYTDHQIKIACEGLAFSLRGHTLQNLAGLQFMIVNAIRQEGFDVTILTPSTVKKHATGSGKASKQDMFDSLPEKVQEIFGKVSKAQGREDLTDAYWIADKIRMA